MSLKYRLHRFNMSGINDPIRLIFAYAKVDFEDVRIERENWPSLKSTTPWGQLSVLEIDTVPLAQSTTIARYLANKFDLIVETDIEAAKCDEYVDVLGDIRAGIYNKIDIFYELESSKFWHEKDEIKKQEVRRHLEDEVLPKYFEKFTQILEKQGNGFLVGKKLSYADISVAQRIDQLCRNIVPNIIEKYPVIKQFVDRVMSQPGIKEYIESISQN